MSNIDKSHKSYVADIKFVPGGVKVDRKNDNFGKSHHFISCSEDGQVNIWDTRTVDYKKYKEAVANNKRFSWDPIVSITLFRAEGGELGLSRILLDATQTTPTFWGASDEGELCFVDWSIRPVPGAENQDVR